MVLIPEGRAHGLTEVKADVALQDIMWLCCDEKDDSLGYQRGLVEHWSSKRISIPLAKYSSACVAWHDGMKLERVMTLSTLV